MTEIAIVVLLFSLITLIVFAVLEYRSREDNLAIEKSSQVINDTPIMKAFHDMHEENEKQYSCFKCSSKRFRANLFEGRFAEIYCLDCGYKEFYNLEMKAGYDSLESEVAGKQQLNYLADDFTGCLKCGYKEKLHYLWDTRFPYKMGGYGEQRMAIFEIFSCKQCAYSEFKDYLYQNNDLTENLTHA